MELTMFKIGDFSKLSQVSAKTLRYYDEIDLLKPGEIDRFTGYRYYTMAQLARLHRILALKDLGLSLEQIRRMLDEALPAAQIHGMLKLKQAEIEQHIADEATRLARVAALLRQIEQEDTMPTQEVVIKRIEPQRVAAIRDVVPTFAAQGQLWGELDGYLGQRHITPIGPCLTIYHDPEYREHDVELEVCEPVASAVAGEGRVKVYELPAVETMACILHHGDFQNVGETYHALLRWIETNGYRIAGCNREVYLLAVADPRTQAKYPVEYLTDSDDQRVTEIQFPIEKV
jgi:DNA-binding transcriptional MerR regulator